MGYFLLDQRPIIIRSYFVFFYFLLYLFRILAQVGHLKISAPASTIPDKIFGTK